MENFPTSEIVEATCGEKTPKLFTVTTKRNRSTNHGNTLLIEEKVSLPSPAILLVFRIWMKENTTTTGTMDRVLVSFTTIA